MPVLFFKQNVKMLKTYGKKDSVANGRLRERERKREDWKREPAEKQLYKTK